MSELGKTAGCGCDCKIKFDELENRFDELQLKVESHIDDYNGADKVSLSLSQGDIKERIFDLEKVLINFSIMIDDYIID